MKNGVKEQYSVDKAQRTPPAQRCRAAAFAENVAWLLAASTAFGGLAWIALLRRTDVSTIDGDPHRTGIVVCVSAAACAAMAGLARFLHRRNDYGVVISAAPARTCRGRTRASHRPEPRMDREPTAFGEPRGVTGAAS